MKRLFLALIALAASALMSESKAQLLDFDGMPPYKLGLTAGLNMPTFSGGQYDYTLGVNGGVDLMLDASDLCPSTFARVQLKYSMKGAKGPDAIPQIVGDANGEVYEVFPKTHYTTHYIELPIHYGYAWSIDSDWTFLAETGPYFAFGLGGTSRPDNESIFESHSFFNHYNASHFDFGWGLQASVLFDQQWQFHIGYDWGFKNMTDVFLQNNGLNIGLTLYFEY